MADDTKAAVTYKKAALIDSERYAGRADLLEALLDDDAEYTIGDVDKAVSAYMKKEVK